MDQHEAVILRRGDPSPSRPLTTAVTNGVAGAILVLGAGAAYLLTQAGPEALAATSRALITTGLVGLVGLVLIAGVSVRLSRTGRESGGEHGGGGGDQQPGPLPATPMDDIDAEFFRMINNERLEDIGAAPPELHADVPADVRAVIWRGSPC
jgi:hypothetical protein